MDNQLDTGLVSDGTDFTEEVNQVGAQLFGCDVLVAVELFLELLQGEALFRTGQAGNHVAYKQPLVIFRHPLEAGFGLGLFLVRIIGFRAGTFQQEEVEGDEGRTLEAQGAASVGQLVGKVGTRPVQHGHEVVGNDVHTAFAEVAQAFLVVVYISLEVSCLCLDMLVYGYAFDNRPAKPYGLYHLLAFVDFFHCPHLTVGDVVQGVHDSGGSGLFDVPKADRIVRTVPAPGLFTKCHIAIMV